MLTAVRRKLEPRAEEHSARVARQVIDDANTLEALAQIAHTPVDLRKLLLAVDVFGILGPIALRRRFGDGPRHGRPLDAPQVTRAVSEAAAQGDRSENAEYIYGKKQLREIDRRVRFLRKRLDGIVVVDRPPDDPDRIFFGAWVQLVDDGGAERELRIVGPDEIDPVRGYVSMDSPLARALMGRRRDDEVGIDTPSGARMWTVIGIRYTAATG